MDKRYLEKRKAVERIFVPENRIADSEVLVVSPSGHYELEICRYSTAPTSWDYSRGIVRRIPDRKVIADVRRNYGHFWYAWVQHANGNEYLLCGEDYQGYTVVNLTKESLDVNFPESGHSGWGFCWAAVYPSPDGRVLAVEGCFWACPYKIVFFDFTEPINLPLPEIDRSQGDLDSVIGWVGNMKFAFTEYLEIRKSDGAKYQDLSGEDRSFLDKNPSQMGEVSERVEWIRVKK